jgi:hypothetical protein
MATITIAEDTPLYGVTNLLNHIQKNRLGGSDWYIAETLAVGTSMPTAKIFHIP